MQDYSKNSELNELNDAINAENSNVESLERLAQILYNVDASAKSSVKINEKNGVFYIKDWSGQIAALAAGANFYGLILGATASLSGAALIGRKDIILGNLRILLFKISNLSGDILRGLLGLGFISDSCIFVSLCEKCKYK